MFTASLEYDRVIRWTRYTGNYQSWTNLYTDDISNSFLELQLQDSISKDIYSGKSINVPITLIEGPIGSVSLPTGSENKAIMEFTIPTPSFEIPSGSNYFVEWEDPDWGIADFYEFNISANTGDEPIEWIVPFE
jgi:hypothetical protein